MKRADTIIDLGPGAGRFGGEITAMGTLEDIRSNPASATGRALKDVMKHPLHGQRRKLPARNSPTGWLRLKGATANNLRNVDVALPSAAFLSSPA